MRKPFIALLGILSFLAACGDDKEDDTLGGYSIAVDEECEGVTGLSALPMMELEERRKVFELTASFRDIEGEETSNTPLTLELAWPEGPRVTCYPPYTTSEGSPVGARVAFEMRATYTTEDGALDEELQAFAVMVDRGPSGLDRFVVAERVQAELRGSFRHDPAYQNVTSLVFVTGLGAERQPLTGNLGGNLFDSTAELRSGVLSSRAGFATWFPSR